MNPEKSLICAIIADALENVRKHNGDYEESRSFLSGENGMLSAWLDLLPDYVDTRVIVERLREVLNEPR